MIEDSAGQSSHEHSNRWHRTGAAILLVDDDRLVRTSLKATISRWGYSVDVAQDGVDALCCLSGRMYDVILTDVQMPMLDGVSLWRQAMVAGHPGTWILMTGSAGPGIQCDIPVLHKPFRLLELRGALEHAIVGGRTSARSHIASDGVVQSNTTPSASS